MSSWTVIGDGATLHDVSDRLGRPASAVTLVDAVPPSLARVAVKVNVSEVLLLSRVPAGSVSAQLDPLLVTNEPLAVEDGVA